MYARVADYLIAYHQWQKAEFRNLVEEAEVEYLLFSEPTTPSPSPSPKPSQTPSRSSSPTILERIEEATELRYYYFLDLSNIDRNARRIISIIFPHSTLDTTNGLYIPYAPSAIQFQNLYDLVRDIRIYPEQRYL
ncbi:hypothetical protein M407DRAFT_23757 [Tulasnella calospora MUT 4182]|uniref:Uncharacterized protein n=1 Tax=Tulasnella calospora MUT 4182 TaxID=1051891 RepID=A0A0C3QJ65_9AGAM|nr:hypothetical protein M407DRAFT_23757 [Tulasnella calospora MUT 4182]